MSNIQIFNNPQFGELRTSGTPDKPYFCLVDVCRALELENHRQVKTRLREKGVISVDTLTSGGLQKVTFIDEPNFYRCVFKSRKDDAVIFQDWVFEEVLPTIRRQGFFGSVPEEDILCAALEIQKKKISSLEKQVKCLSSPHAKKERKRRLEVNKADEWIESGRIAAIASGNGGWIPFHKIMDAYVQFCKDEHVKRIGKNLLGEKLQRKFEHKKRRDTTWYAVFIVNE